jgi:hypothetical protein
MKAFIGMIALMITGSVFATEFNVKIEDINCTISANGAVTRTQKVGVATFTEKKTVSMTGLDALVAKAVEVSSQVPASQEEEYVYTMIQDGKSYTLNLKESKESQTLIRLTSRICR